MVQYFCSGTLGIPYGTTLRSYLAQQLHCDPMRISKKLLPGSIVAGFKMVPKIGRRGYYPRPTRDSDETIVLQQQAEQRLVGLRAAFIASLDALREEEDKYELLEARYRDYYQQRTVVAVASVMASVSMSNSSPGERKRRLLETEWGVRDELASPTYPSSRPRTHPTATPYSGHQLRHSHHGTHHTHQSPPASRRQYSAAPGAPPARPHRVIENSTVLQQLPSLWVSLERASIIMAAKHSK